jgi:putative selenate reductase
MDAARVALRLPGAQKVRISYRRAKEDMPADREELENALAEGATLLELTLPERGYAGTDGPRLSLREMEGGELDASGRRSPRPTDRTLNLECDLLITAVGESPDPAVLAAFGIALGPDGLPLYDRETQRARGPGQAGRPAGRAEPRVFVGGDAARGPASIISAAADGRRAALAILRAAGAEPAALRREAGAIDADRLAARGEFLPSVAAGSEAFVRREAERCLRCDSACLRCVEVCPNRANFALAVPPVPGEFAQAIQILHLDPLCNECGNCGLFCPYEGEPYRGKPSLFADEAELRASGNAGFCLVAGGGATLPEGPALVLRELPGGEVRSLRFGEWSRGGSAGDSPMASLARVVHRDHPYLLGGER